MKDKIDATVAILTLNSEATLWRCLESVEDFAEIIICDGNSTDKTLEIAKSYDAKVVPQFRSRKKNIKIKDKARARNVALDASTKDWHFWLDSDDALSPELVEEIKEIVIDKKPCYLVYKVPLRHVIAGRVIKHSSNYPLYQERLFNRKTGVKFIKPVHERITFDREKYNVGVLKNYYNIHWSQERVDSFWRTINHYVKLQIEELEPTISWRNYWRWIIGFELMVFLGMIVRILWQYFRYGFEDTMLVKVELARLGGKLLLIGKVTVLLLKKTVGTISDWNHL